MQRLYKKYKVSFYNNNNQLKIIFIDADNGKQAMTKIMDKFNIYRVRVASVSLFSRTYL